MLEECAGALCRLVDDLIGNHQVPWLEFLAQASHRARGKDVGAAELLKREDVRPIPNLRGAQQMPWPVTRKDQARHAGPRGFDDRVAGISERRIDFMALAVLSPQRLAKAGAADQADFH